jgi:integrase
LRGQIVTKRVRESLIDNRTARSRLASRRKPYYRKLEEGVHLGYRKPKGHAGRPATSGKWVLRQYIGDGIYRVSNIAIADDYSDADGIKILNFSQAVSRAREHMVEHARHGVAGPLTVAQALTDYFAYLDHNGQDSYDSRRRAGAFILPALGRLECSKLTAEKLRAWLAALAKTPPRQRTAKGEPQQYGEIDHTDAEMVRRRRASANRNLTVLRAALNHAFREGKVSSDIAWRRVRPFRSVDAARIRFLSVAEAKRLINATDPEFRPMVEAALCTGCRYSELGRLEVQDFDPDTGTLAIRQSKSGKPRKVYLTDEGLQLFKRLAAGRISKDLLLRHANGRPWAQSNQQLPMRLACAHAKIAPPVSFHQLRHTFASLCVKAGMPLKVVAEALGHASTAITEKHYAHLAPSHVADTIRKHAPVFGLGKSNVVGLR